MLIHLFSDVFFQIFFVGIFIWIFNKKIKVLLLKDLPKENVSSIIISQESSGNDNSLSQYLDDATEFRSILKEYGYANTMMTCAKTTLDLLFLFLDMNHLQYNQTTADICIITKAAGSGKRLPFSHKLTACGVTQSPSESCSCVRFKSFRFFMISRPVFFRSIYAYPPILPYTVSFTIQQSLVSINQLSVELDQLLDIVSRSVTTIPFPTHPFVLSGNPPAASCPGAATYTVKQITDYPFRKERTLPSFCLSLYITVFLPADYRPDTFHFLCSIPHRHSADQDSHG